MIRDKRLKIKNEQRNSRAKFGFIIPFIEFMNHIWEKKLCIHFQMIHEDARHAIACSFFYGKSNNCLLM